MLPLAMHGSPKESTQMLLPCRHQDHIQGLAFIVSALSLKTSCEG